MGLLLTIAAFCFVGSGSSCEDRRTGVVSGLSTRDDFVDWYERGPLARYVVQRHTLGERMVNMIEARQPAGDMSNPPVPGLNLVLHLTGRNADVQYGPVKFRARARSGSFFLSVPGEASRVEADQPHAIRIFWIPRPVLKDVLDEGGHTATDFGNLHAGPFSDCLLEQFLRTLWQESGSLPAVPRLYAKTAAQFLIQRLLLLAGKRKQLRHGGLAPWQVRRVEQYLRAEFAKDIAVSDLAQLVGLSTKHFARAFREATGLPPHRLLIRIRLENAASLLEKCKNLPLAEIATTTGFSDQSHFTVAFRKAMGMTPAAYRRLRSH